MHSVSLDAAKAFDKLWRVGLFYKLIDCTDPIIWRILFNYYFDSFIIVCVDGLLSNPFRTSEGVKQGGILSPFLFNFFLDDLIKNCQNLGIGASIGSFNTSILAYCDDILLMASNENHMSKLLECCCEYAIEWKLEFNALKSSSFSLVKTHLSDFTIGSTIIPSTNGFVYLGLPIGNDTYVQDFFSEKMSKCEKSLYSLRAVGCRSNMLNPKSIAFIYKQYCQSILKFGLEHLFLKDAFINELNIRQNLLLKNVLGIKYHSRFKPLLKALGVESIYQLYLKHKTFGLKQVCKNGLSYEIYEYLLEYYANEQAPKQSFLSQLDKVTSFTGTDMSELLSASVITSIDAKFTCNDIELSECISAVLNNYNTFNSYFYINLLSNFLYVEF